MERLASSNDRPGPAVLQRLLKRLYLKPSPDVLTYEQIREQLAASAPAAVIFMLEQSRRITWASRDYGQMGLSAFHQALLYLYWGQFLNAANLFQEAAFYWRLINERAYVCLAGFGQAVAQHNALHFEEAMVNYMKSQSALGQAESVLIRSPQPHHIELPAFFADLRVELELAQLLLRRELWDLLGSEGQSSPTGDETRVEAPIIDEALTPIAPISAPALLDGQLYYEIVEQRDNFLPLQPGDLLVVEDRRGQRGTFKQNSLVVVSGTPQAGSVQVRTRSGPGPGESAYLARLKGKHQSGRPIMQIDGSGKIVMPRTYAILGLVLRLWRPVDV
jgi:hypothetical protein